MNSTAASKDAAEIGLSPRELKAVFGRLTNFRPSYRAKNTRRDVKALALREMERMETECANLRAWLEREANRSE